MKNIHFSTRKACLLSFVLLMSSFFFEAFAQKDSLNKYQNNYRYAVQLEVSQNANIKLERVWGKLRKTRLGISSGIGYSNSQIFTNGFDFSKGFKKTHFISNIHLLIPVSPNSDIEAGLSGNYNVLSKELRKSLPNEMIVMLKAGYRWHTSNRKWSFHVGGLLTLADNLDSNYTMSTVGQSFRFNIGDLTPSIAIGRTF